MKSKPIKIICVGKLKAAFWQMAADHYLKLLQRWRQIEVLEIKDGTGAARICQESERIIAQLRPKDVIIALSETGQNFTSTQFASFLRNNDESAAGRLTFIIGGPFGLAPDVLERSRFQLCLSAMTWPHELARVLLLEQLFRAETILHNTPYHH